MLHAVAVENGLLRLKALLHRRAHVVGLRRVLQFDEEQLLGLHVRQRIIQRAVLELRRVEAVKAAHHLVVALLHCAEVHDRGHGVFHRLKGLRADRVGREFQPEEGDRQQDDQPARQLEQNRLIHWSYPPPTTR